MSSKHIETRQKLKNICRVSTFEQLINECTLSEDEKTLLRMYYLQKKNFGYIADELGFSESTIKKKHRAVLQKLGKLI